MKNAPQVLFEWLTTAGTSLYTLVGDRVWPDQIRKGYTNTAAALVMSTDEIPNSRGDQVRVRATFRCYGGGASDAAARAVYAALNDRLHNASGATTSGGIISAFQETGGGRLDDPDEGWPMRVAVYDVVAR